MGDERRAVSRLRAHGPLVTLVVVALCSTVWSAIRPHDYPTWLFELMLGFLGVGVLLATYHRFRFSSLVYVAVAAHFVVLAVGAKYTYAEMPLFDWLKDALHLSRNHYDRVGHFMQGLTPALLCRELLLRTSRLGRGRWLALVSVAVPLAMSAFYELLEMWWVAAFYPNEGAAWLGLQGDIWDPQWDMTMALLGAICVVVLLSRLHDRSMAAAAPGGQTGNPKSE